MSRAIKHRVEVNQQAVDIWLVRTAQRKRTIALQISPEGRLSVRAPLRTPLAKVVEIVRKKAEWIHLHQAGFFGLVPEPSPPREFVAGESFHFLGQQYRLKVEQGEAGERATVTGKYFCVSCAKEPARGKANAKEQIRAQLESWYIQQAKEFLPGRIERWKIKLGIDAEHRLVVADQSRRWASCGAGGVIRFNWRLMGAPISLVDYVIVHELCHLRWPNHSATFWRELLRVMPDYPERERRLAIKGAAFGF